MMLQMLWTFVGIVILRNEMFSIALKRLSYGMACYRISVVDHSSGISCHSRQPWEDRKYPIF